MVTHYEYFNIVNGSEIYVSGSVRLDNGMTVSVAGEFEVDQFTAIGNSCGQGTTVPAIVTCPLTVGSPKFELARRRPVRKILLTRCRLSAP